METNRSNESWHFSDPGTDPQHDEELSDQQAVIEDAVMAAVLMVLEGMEAIEHVQVAVTITVDEGTEPSH